MNAVPMMTPPSKNKAKFYSGAKKARAKTKAANAFGATVYEKMENKVRCVICVENKLIDGKPVMVYELKHDDYSNTQRPKEECYTDADKFGAMVTEKIKQIAKDLS